MGSFFTRLWWGGDPDLVDPLSGLTRRDINHVRNTWAIVYKDPEGNGTELFRRYFKVYPESKKFFKMLEGVTESEFQHNFQFRAHVIKLTTSLNMIIQHLHQPDVARAMLQSIGVYHNKRHIKKIHFNQLKKVFLTMLSEVLFLDNDKLIPWDKTFSFMYKAIFEHIDDDSECTS